MIAGEEITLRPSALPKLAACAKYEPDPIAGEAAQRGTALDAVYRSILNGQTALAAAKRDPEVTWAVETTTVLAGGADILSAEDDLRIECLGMTGTADAAVPDRDFSIDLKSGEERNYLEQQAAYALGMMDRFFADEWSVYLLYCDLRKVVRLDFTRADAERIVREVIAKVLDDLATPTPCEYCDWCAARFRCKKRLEGVAWWAGLDPATIDWDAHLADPEKLSAFLGMCSAIAKEGGLNDMARARCKALILGGTDVPGYVLQSRKGSEFVLPIDVGHVIQRMGFEAVLTAYGNLSAEKFRTLWAERITDRPFPEEAVQTGPGSQFVKAVSKKKKSQS